MKWDIINIGGTSSGAEEHIFQISFTFTKVLEIEISELMILAFAAYTNPYLRSRTEPGGKISLIMCM